MSSKAIPSTDLIVRSAEWRLNISATFFDIFQAISRKSLSTAGIVEIALKEKIK
jgi:hypothetical protein